MTLGIKANISVENDIISSRVKIKTEYIKAFKTLCKEAEGSYSGFQEGGD